MQRPVITRCGMGNKLRRSMTQQKNERLIAEYNALEKRIQNDSNIAYALITTFMAFSVALFGGIGAILSQYSNQAGRIVSSILIAGMSLFSLIIGGWIQERFNRTGKMRIVRAEMLEQELSFFSFRLFRPDEWQNEPWRKGYCERFTNWQSEERFGRHGASMQDAKSVKDWADRFPRITDAYKVFVVFMGITWLSFIFYLVFTLLLSLGLPTWTTFSSLSAFGALFVSWVLFWRWAPLLWIDKPPIERIKRLLDWSASVQGTKSPPGK